MKVDAQEPPSESGAAKQAPDGARFKKALQQADPRRMPPRGTTPEVPGTARPGVSAVRAPALPLARASSPVVATARGALASPENLVRTRQVMHLEAQRLGTFRSEASTQVQERTEQRVTELIARELSRDLRAPPPPPLEARPPPGATSPEPGRHGMDAPPQESRAVASVAAGGASASGAGEPGPGARTEAALELIERIEVFVKSQRPALSLSLRGGLDATVEVERTGPREVALRIQGRNGPLPSEDLARLREGLEARGLRLRSLRAE
ncbi:hypothetical protein [Myxococcus sp. RHSTA-1-4]|uniref:hypothetical protein n=1 Tax=Myxococcus sp. RHSTA-1-4 TaxID=2874601 RepID=UPI001CBCF8C8|nr:hypothetical protein [Myxococcus sp. RHSTA-1-4]MBZ4415979.1 hypothetical protein [Myxococcus sp. RHSTA-1-4]